MVTTDLLERIRYAIIETSAPWWDSAQAVEDVRSLLESYEKQNKYLDLILTVLNEDPDDPMLGEKIHAILSR